MASGADSLRMVVTALGKLWSAARSLARMVVGLLVALVLLFEEWGWRPLADGLALLARYRPWARVEGWIASLPPYAALLVFVLPTAILLPVKLGALWLLAHGKILTAALLLALAKIASTALLARIFMLTSPALMQLTWFFRLYSWFMPWKDALMAPLRASWAWRYGRMLKAWARRAGQRAWQQAGPWLRRTWAHWQPILATWRLRWRLAFRRVWHRLRAALHK